MKKNNYPKITVSGSAKWMTLDKHDTKFKKEFGEYNAQVLIEDAAIAERLVTDLTKQANTFLQEQIKAETNPGKKKKLQGMKIQLPIRPAEDKEGNEIPNTWVFKAAKPGGYKDKDGNVQNLPAPVVVDANVKVVKGVRIGSGSRVKVSVELRPYVMPATEKYGVSARLNGVQIIELVEYSGGGDPNSMFSKEEGFTADDANEPDLAPVGGGDGTDY